MLNQLRLGLGVFFGVLHGKAEFFMALMLAGLCRVAININQRVPWIPVMGVIGHPQSSRSN